MNQHYKDIDNNIYGYKPDNIETTPITIEEAKIIQENKKTVDDLKTITKQTVRSLFNQAEVLPITINTVDYHGGYESASKLNNALMLAEKAGLTEVTFYDIHNTGHVLTLADAEAVTIQIAVDYQNKLGIKQNKMREIDACTTKAEVEAVIVEGIF